MRGAVRHDLAADEPVLLVDADMGFVAEDGNGEVDRLPPVQPGLCLIVPDRPARVRPNLARRLSLFDRRLLVPGDALVWHDD